MEKTSLSGAWEFRQAGTEEWLPAAVPGGVHTDLLALGRIPDPFVGDNEKRVMWVAEADWEYRRSFLSPGGCVERSPSLPGLRWAGYARRSVSQRRPARTKRTICSASTAGM